VQRCKSKSKPAVMRRYKSTDDMRGDEALSEGIYFSSMCSKVFGCLAREAGDHAP